AVPWHDMRGFLNRLVSIADEPTDDDDLRLRRRMGVVAGYITIPAALTVIPLSPDPALGMGLGLGLSIFAAANLVLLARTHHFERYVVALISMGIPFTVIANVLNGGVAAGGAGMMWGFLVPLYAIIALGPRQATKWFVIFLVGLFGFVAIDPIVISRITPPPYETRLVAYVLGIAGPCAITFFLLRYTDLRRRQAQARSDELLYNAIPISIATRMKHGEHRIAEVYEETTVLFGDIASFTPWAQRTDPALVVGLLDTLFTRFDELAAICGVEKIKTIGDAYMAVAGAPEARADHAEAALAMARRMLGAATDWRAANGLDLQMRIGLASGKVVGGVIGQKRILFDLWGDTVNAASRMESSGLPGRIQVAPTTWELLREGHDFEPREIDVKGLGPMTTHLLVETHPS
ncbi:MAG: adenylate/guanylate cyclase domain-containing protein, partial [Chloroflexota bacterium]